MRQMAFVLAAALSACGVGTDPETLSVAHNEDALDARDGHGRPEPDMLGAHEIRGASHHHGGGSPNMTLHGGAVLSAPTQVTNIFWGPKWGNASFVGDKQTGLAQFYGAVGGSSYSRTNGEFAGSNGQLVSTSISYVGQQVDTSATPRSAPQTSAVLAEVCKMISNPTSTGYYAVYTDIPRGNAGYCAWHSWGTCGSTNVQFAFFFSLDGDSGCDPVDTTSGRSQGLSALANVTGHELSETLTDPRGAGWFDSSGAENGDKCAWAFDQAVQLSDGSSWKIQGNWSNAAYNAGTGFPNTSGQRGCLYNN